MGLGGQASPTGGVPQLQGQGPGRRCGCGEASHSLATMAGQGKQRQKEQHLGSEAVGSKRGEQARASRRLLVL